MTRFYTAFPVAAMLAILPVGGFAADDKSASSVIQLPSAGGTVSQEEGAFQLNANTGSANFSLPLPELPQRGKFGPGLFLSYNQFAGDSGSGLGVGWSFTASSVIVNQDFGTAIPGRKPDGDFFHRLSFQGARLVYLGEIDGLPSYRPEVAEEQMVFVRHDMPFEVVVLDRTGEQEVITIPAGFELRMADGSRMYFSGAEGVAEGNFATAEPTITRWPLVMSVNTNRDAVRYEYEKHGERSYLTGVAFAGGQSRYDFDLIDTRASLVSHIAGVRQQNPKLYGKVTASFAGDVYDQWCMAFIGRSLNDNTEFTVRTHPDCQAMAESDLAGEIDPNSVNVLDQLRAVYRFGNTGGSALGDDTLRYPDLRFDYSSWTAAELAERELVFPAPNLAFAGDISPQNLELADLNMDALLDVVQTSDTEVTRVHLGEGALESAFETSIPLKLTRTTASGLTREITPRLVENRFHFADITGDTYADILEVEDGLLHVFNGNAVGDFPYIGRAIPLDGISPSLFSDGNGRFVDVNLDGLSDIVATRLDANGRTEALIYLNLTRRQPDGGHAINFARVSKVLPMDSQDGGLLSRQSTRLTDVNGDRLPDLVTINVADQGFCIYENQGNIFSREAGALLWGDMRLNDPKCGSGRFTAIRGMSPSDNVQSMWYVDANGDGVRDFASMGSRTDEIQIWLGFGDGSFADESLRLSLNARVQVGNAPNSFRSRVADLDADGQAEIIVFQQASGPEIAPVVVIDFNRTTEIQLVKANLLTVVSFESGRRHDIRYATSTDEMLRDRAAGRETATLHFPVVVAKQMVTSEGVANAARRDVQVEEYFYHKPFYDVINRRFIGFSEVERVIYGDEFVGGADTQKSSIAFEQYYAFADVTADLHLAGKLRIRQTYAVDADPVLLAAAAGSASLDPNAAGLHSLSTATRAQKLPTPGAMLSCESNTWQTAPTGIANVSWLRKTEERLTAAAGPQHVQEPSDTECVNPVKTRSFAEFDEFNYAGRETETVVELTGPEGQVMPGYARVTETDYSEARATLAPLGIVNAASARRTVAGTRLLSRERFAYLPENGGRLGMRAIDVFSSLADVPPEIADWHSATHTLLKNMAYDRFGNVVEMSDNLSKIESVTFDETGTLPTAHTKFHGSDDSRNQVTTMAYDDGIAGRLSGQTTPLGMEINYDYDALGRKLRELSADGSEKRYAYRFGLNGAPSMILTSLRRYPSAADTPEGESEFVRSLAAFNARGNQLAEMEDVAEGGVRMFKYSEFNRNELLTFRWTPYMTETVPDVEAAFASGQVPEPERRHGNAYRYDGLGRMIEETHPSGKFSTQSYAPWGMTTITTYEDQHGGSMSVEEHRLVNDVGVHAVMIGDASGTSLVTRFDRDGFGYLTAIRLAGEEAPRQFRFNSVGDMEFQQIPGLGTHYYFYDERGRQWSKARIAEDGTTDVIAFEYDLLNRKLLETVNGEDRIRYAYDVTETLQVAAAFETPIPLPLGKHTRIEVIDPNGRHDSIQRFGWDANGRMVQNEIEIAGEVFAESFHQTLDGRINRATGPGGLGYDFALGPDRNLRRVAITHPDFSGPETVIEDITYNPESRIDQIAYRAGAVTELTYNRETLFLEEIVTRTGDGTALQDISMTFNGNGSITEIVDRLAAGPAPAHGHVDRSGTFHYDFRNQLVRYLRYGEDAAFEYTDAGAFSRNDEMAAGETLVPPSDADTDLIPVGASASPYSFDGFGQLAASPKVTATVFDAYGRLIRAQTLEHDVFFGYDQTGRRTYKDVVPLDDAGAAELYLFPTETFHRGPKGDESFVNIGSTRLVRMEHGTGRWFYYLKDHLDSSDYVMTSAGVPVEQMLYRAYGTEHQPQILSSDWASHEEAVADEKPREKTHHRFTGKYLDDATGLYYYGARYYDPALGRFISPDPLYLSDPERCVGNTIACTLFAYANNNPMSFIDPTGLEGIVQGDEAYRRQVEESLQRVDPTARVDMETGEISQSWLHGLWLDIKSFFTGETNFDTGRELVSRIVEDPQTTTISFQANAAGGARADGQPFTSSTPGDINLVYDPSYLPALPEYDASTGTLSYETPDPGVVLGHELIHATHGMRGDVGSAIVNYTGLDGSPQSAWHEEIRTTGVGGVNSPDDITENDLREMLGINPRNHY
ncbi:RHS repeat-associated core domain-containing protein [Roseovarius mucosus]|uniref:RHS repeat-associated core domain-containing protein n=1 Tax=Roseovarius mucosus TaxID=215743 RepID=UPI003F6F2AF8